MWPSPLWPFNAGSTVVLASLQNWKKPRSQNVRKRSRESKGKEKVQRKERVLTAPRRGSCSASPAGLLLTARTESGPVPVPTPPHPSLQKELERAGEGRQCRRGAPGKERALAAGERGHGLK